LINPIFLWNYLPGFRFRHLHILNWRWNRWIFARGNRGHILKFFRVSWGHHFLTSAFLGQNSFLIIFISFKNHIYFVKLSLKYFINMRNFYLCGEISKNNFYRKESNFKNTLTEKSQISEITFHWKKLNFNNKVGFFADGPD
jgi:hypothetical protein